MGFKFIEKPDDVEGEAITAVCDYCEARCSGIADKLTRGGWRFRLITSTGQKYAYCPKHRDLFRPPILGQLK